VPTPFGWNPPDFWVPVITLGVTALYMAIGIPLSTRWWHRTDRTERVRVAGVLRDLAGELGGEFAGPREVMGVDDDGDPYGPVLDYGTALVTSSGLAVEVGVQVMGGSTGKCVRLRAAAPEGRVWIVDRLHARAFRWEHGDPRDLRTFRRSYRTADPERLGPDARAALVELVVRGAVDVRLDGAGLTVWALPPTGRASPRISGITEAAALVPHVRRVAGAARLLLAEPPS